MQLLCSGPPASELPGRINEIKDFLVLFAATATRFGSVLASFSIPPLPIRLCRRAGVSSRSCVCDPSSLSPRFPPSFPTRASRGTRGCWAPLSGVVVALDRTRAQVRGDATCGLPGGAGATCHRDQLHTVPRAVQEGLRAVPPPSLPPSLPSLPRMLPMPWGRTRPEGRKRKEGARARWEPRGQGALIDALAHLPARHPRGTRARLLSR